MAELSQKMIEHVHLNPDFLKICIFNEVRRAAAWRQNPKGHHEEKTMVETFEEMCEMYGDDAMEYEEYEYWYIKFYSGNFEMDDDWRSSDYCPPSSLQRFIFSAVVLNLSVWNSFKIYCKIEGNEMVDYPDYEFWFMRFARGELNMDYDRSADPKHRSFVDLPIHVFEKISENFDLSDKLSTRNVCKSLQSSIDRWISNIKNITICNSRYKTSLCFDNERIIYSNQSYYDDSSEDDDSFIQDYSLEEEDCTVRTWNSQFSVKNEKHWRLGFKTLKAVFNNSRIRLNSLKITNFYEEHTEHFLAMLKSLNGKQIHVENFEVSNRMVFWKVLPIIAHLKPDILKTVQLAPCFNDLMERKEFKERIDRIGGYEQIKKVKMLTFKNYFLLNEKSFKYFLGFPRVTIEVGEFMSYEGNAALVIENLVKSTVLEVFYITMDQYDFDVNDTIELLESGAFQRVPNRENVIRHKVPESDQFYEIEITEKMIRIERMP